MNSTDAADVYKQTSFEFCAKISMLRAGTEFDMLQRTVIVLIFLTKIGWPKCHLVRWLKCVHSYRKILKNTTS